MRASIPEMYIGSQALIKRWDSWLQYAVLAILLLSGFVIAILGAALWPAEVAALHLLDSMTLAKSVCLLVGGIAVALALVRHPDITLALFFLVGLVKGDPSLSQSPVDLTVVTAAILAISAAWKLLSSATHLELPREYFLYLPLLSMMVLSLTYTPDVSAGAEKALRFICLTGIGIIGPFIFFDSTKKIRRCFYVLIVGGIGLAINSLSMLGSGKRFVAPSGLNTELGAASAVALILIWSLIFPRLRFFWRLFFYPAMGILVVALLGSGGRFANVSAALCIFLGAILYRPLLKDIAILGGAALVALPLLWIPSASYQYLDSLRHPTLAMGTRSDLMALGVKIFSDHPLLGVGVGGFQFVSPNPITYNFPHNIVLELAAEMGIFAALSFVLIAFFCFRESLRQLSVPSTDDTPLIRAVFLLLVYVLLDSMISGDINDLRFMWFILSLPFVLRMLISGAQPRLDGAIENAGEVPQVLESA
ncbi:MAG TPA: O-antigen ligase family protein [Candidatus Acidoferrum sp.]|nr:O-antigen ligase family protein [Candidatus Acidoferrum sp.]